MPLKIRSNLVSLKTQKLTLAHVQMDLHQQLGKVQELPRLTRDHETSRLQSITVSHTARFCASRSLYFNMRCLWTMLLPLKHRLALAESESSIYTSSSRRQKRFPSNKNKLGITCYSSCVMSPATSTSSVQAALSYRCPEHVVSL